MPKVTKYCIKRVLKTDQVNSDIKLTIVDAYNRKVYDTENQRNRILDAQNNAHINTQWIFIPFEIEVDSTRTLRKPFDPDDPKCNLIKPDTFKGNRTIALKNKIRNEDEQRRKEDLRKKSQSIFEEREKDLINKMTPEQMAHYVALKIKEGN